MCRYHGNMVTATCYHRVHRKQRFSPVFLRSTTNTRCFVRLHAEGSKWQMRTKTTFFLRKIWRNEPLLNRLTHWVSCRGRKLYPNYRFQKVAVPNERPRCRTFPLQANHVLIRTFNMRRSWKALKHSKNIKQHL